jgi:uncharacterized membrane protein (UPF0182 family)
MGETLDGALAALFGGAPGPAREATPVAATRPVAPGAPVADSGFRALAAEARRRYQAALQAQRELDWTRYGEEMRQLGVLLDRLGPGGSEPRR